MDCIEILKNHQCRTCYNATKGLKLLTSFTKCNGKQQQKSLAELLMEISNINVMDDIYKELPQYICDGCTRKLKTAHTFVQQVQEVNERLITMVMDKEVDKHIDCLEEAQVDIQSCLEIKMELDEVDAQEVSAVECNVEMKVKGVDENLQISHLNENVLNTKKDGDKNIDLLTLKGVNDSTFDIERKFRNKNIINKELSKYNENKESDTLLSNEEKDDDDNLDNQSDDTEWQEKLDNTCIKEDNKKNDNIKPKRTEGSRALEEDDIAVPCSQCNKIFNNSKALTRHQRTSHIPEDQKCACPLCFRKFSRSCNMYTHMRTFHGPDTVPLIRKPSTQERIFQCDRCTRNYTKKKHLNIHIKNKHSNDNNEKNKEKSTKDNTELSKLKSSKSKTYEVRSLCFICGSSFSSKTHLIVHMRRHTGERPFKCDFCERAYPRISELTCHRRIHTGEKPFICKICGKAFRVSSKMTTHMRSHTNIRPYKCTQCERSFKYSKDLSIHFRIHTGERPYCCNVCGSTFTQSNTLKAHRAKLGHMDNVIEIDT